jgi:hypothetical protein
MPVVNAIQGRGSDPPPGPLPKKGGGELPANLCIHLIKAGCLLLMLFRAEDRTHPPGPLPKKGGGELPANLCIHLIKAGCLLLMLFRAEKQ